MSVSSTRTVMDRYFQAMGAEEDFARFFDEDVTWLMVDTGQEVRGPGPVRYYLNELHSKMLTGNQRDLVVTDGHAVLEGDGVNAENGAGPGLAYCLVYDVGADSISAMRCYGSLARLMANPNEGVPLNPF